MTSQLMSDFINKNVIPVSLVEETIEELKNENYQISFNSEVAFDSGITKNNFKIQVLQKLLEKRKKEW